MIWRSPLGVTLIGGVLVVSVLALLGQSNVWVSPDTASYVASTSLADMRLPVYGWLASPWLVGPTLPVLQILAYLAASCWLVAALRGLGVSWAAGVAVGLALMCSNLVLLWARAALPELPGHAAILVALALVVELAAGRQRGWRIVACGCAVTLAWALRPSLLPFIVLLPILLAFLPRRVPMHATIVLLALACALPAIGLAALRYERLGDANVVSFGGFQMAGMAALMLTPELAERLPEPERAEAQAVIVQRNRLVAEGRMADLPRNSAGERSFTSVAVLYFDILARMHDTLLYEGVGSLRADQESWVSFNARMQKLALTTLRAAPVSYAAWLVGALSRLVGHAIVLNGAFVVASGLLALAVLVRPKPLAAAAAMDVPVLLVLSAIWLAGTATLIVFTTFPAERYIDSAGLLLPIWPIYAMLRMWRHP